MTGFKYALTQSRTYGHMVIGLLTFLVYQGIRALIPALTESLPDGGDWLLPLLVGGPVIKESARNFAMPVTKAEG